ncbi:TolC family protein [Gallibacterium genomosp. 3]|uniref:Outer membrane channel protein n=1 Tax=Gallibacterium genomosp. 3 TaxID=505345 RepID=A0A1A7PSW3_9PAST|nr:TolC family protein [Gallibacterium genomosp. 3]OBX04245.1 outer membrane channel protein [Gallibacterium genomosp. 3]
MQYKAFFYLILGCFLYFIDVTYVYSSSQTSLKQILEYTFAKDPELLEAKTNTMIAHSQTEQAISGHYPTFSVFGRQPLDNYSKSNTTESNSHKFIPGVSSSMNIYSFGAVEKKIAHSSANEESFRYKYDEVKENIAYKVTELYLMVLRYKDTISAQSRGLARLQTIIQEIGAIADNDEGRRSEFVQAQARLFSVEQQMNSTERDLQDTLSQLQRYSGTKVNKDSVQDPFDTLTPNLLAKHYSQSQHLHPSYRVANAKIKTAQASLEAEKASHYPKIDVIGQLTKDERQVYLNVSWDVFNRSNSYSVQEKAQMLSAEKSRLEQTVLDLQEKNRKALINLDEYNKQIKTLSKQVNSLYEVTQYYKLQFSIAKRSLLDLLNAENELLNAELNKVSTEYQFRHSYLDYLYSQGMTYKWASDLK